MEPGFYDLNFSMGAKVDQEKLSAAVCGGILQEKANIKDDGFGLFIDPMRPSVLLHACCGPCATSCVERIAFDYNVTVYFYNPNIMDGDEYSKRRESLIRFLYEFNEENVGKTRVAFIEGRYDPLEFIKRADRLKDEPEGGKRCDICFEMRLSGAARKAEELGIQYFTTTMSVSPHKNYNKIRMLGNNLEHKYNTKFLDIDFKKKNGFGRSVELSKKHGLYRQNFCGCEYARLAQLENESNKERV